MKLQLREEVERFLSRGKQTSDEKGVEKSAKVAKHEDTGDAPDEEEKLQRPVEDLRQQLERQYHDLRGRFGVVNKRLEAVIDADAGAMRKQDFLMAMLMAMRSAGFDAPRLASVLPSGNSNRLTVCLRTRKHRKCGSSG